MFRRILDSPWTYFLLAGLLLVAAVASQFRLHIPSRPEGSAEDIAALSEREHLNVLFVMIDTLRAHRLGGYGYERPTSRVLDELGDYGIRFTTAEAQSTWTKTSMASLWTGVNPYRAGVTRHDHAVPKAATLPAEIFREAGYRTAGFWRNGWVAPNFQFDQGFEIYVKPTPSRPPEGVQQRHPGSSPLQGTDEDVTEAAVEYIRAHSDEPFFLYLHYMDVHQYLYDQKAAEQDLGTSYSDAYDASIHWTDRNVGRVLLALEDLDLFEDTLVVVAADHGEEFYEHGREGHAKTLYEEVTRVPLVIGLPFLLEPGVEFERLVPNVDLWPTVLDMAGLPPLPEADGRSRLPELLAAARGEPLPEPPEGSEQAVGYLDNTWGRTEEDPLPLVSVREKPWKLVYPAGGQGPVQLYDHRDDPREQNNVAGEHPERVERMRARAERSLEREQAWGGADQVEIDDMRMNQLRALGYVVDEGEEGEKREEERPQEGP